MARRDDPQGRGRSPEGSAALKRKPPRPKKVKPPPGVKGPVKPKPQQQRRPAPPPGVKGPVQPVEISTGRGEQRPTPRSRASSRFQSNLSRYQRTIRLLNLVEHGKGSTKDVQQFLNREGHKLAVDDEWGPKTAAAWKAHAGRVTSWATEMDEAVKRQQHADQRASSREGKRLADEEQTRYRKLRLQGLSEKAARQGARAESTTPYAEAVREVERERVMDETRRHVAARAKPEHKGFLQNVVEKGAWQALSEGINKRVPGAHVPGPPKGLQRASQKYNRIVLGSGSSGEGYKGASFGGGIGGNLIADVANTTLGFPAGLLKIGNALRKDVSLDEPFKFEHTRRDVLTPIGKSYKETYGPFARGDIRQGLKNIEAHPLGPILDAAALASLGTSAALKGTRIVTAGARGNVPRQRIVRYETGKVQPHASPNQLVRILQHKKDRASEANPEALLTTIPLGKGTVSKHVPIGLTTGARRRVARRLPYELEREFERTGAPAVRLQQARNFVRSPRKIFAYDVLMRYGDKALERLDQEIAFRQERRHGVHREGRDFEGEGKVTLAEAMSQSAQIYGLKLARKRVQLALAGKDKRLLRAVDAGRDLTHFYQDTKVALGELTPESAGPRVDLPSRIVTGAKVEPIVEFAGFKPGKVKPGRKAARSAQASLTRIDAYQAELAKAEAAFEKTKGQTRPRTEREAKIRRQTLEEELVDDFKEFARGELGIEKGDPFKGFGDAKEQLKRNYHNWLLKEHAAGNRHKGTARALREGGHKPTVKGEQLQEFADEFFRQPQFAAKLDELETVEQGLADLEAFRKGGAAKPGTAGGRKLTEDEEFDAIFGKPEQPVADVTSRMLKEHGDDALRGEKQEPLPEHTEQYLKRHEIESMTDEQLQDIVSKASSRTGDGQKWSARTRAAFDELGRRREADKKRQLAEEAGIAEAERRAYRDEGPVDEVAEDMHAHEVFKSTRDKGDVPVELRPYAMNEPGGWAARAIEASHKGPDASIDLVLEGKPATLLGGKMPPHVVLTLRKRAEKEGLVWLPVMMGRDFVHVVARDEAAASRLADALNMNTGPAATAEIGRALGYSERDVRRFTRRRWGKEAPPPPRPKLELVKPELDELTVKRQAKIERELTALRALHSAASEGDVKARLAAQIAGLEQKLKESMPQPAPTLQGDVPNVLPGQRTVEQVERAAKMPRKPGAAEFAEFLGEVPTSASERLGTRVSMLRDLLGKEERSWERRKPVSQELRRSYVVTGKHIVGGEPAGPGAAFMPDVAQRAVHSLLSRAQGVLGKQQKARYQYQSEGVLFSQGRIRRGPQVTLEEFHLVRRRAQQQLDVLRASTFTKELNRESSTWRDPDFVFFNPQAYKLPRNVREDPAQTVLGMTPDELARADKSFWEGAFPERVQYADIEAAQAAGVKQIHREVANAFVQQAPIFVGVRLLPTLGRAALSLIDAGNNMSRLGLLYLKGSFVPANYAGNIIFLGIEHGPKAVKYLAKGSTLLRLVRDSTWAPLPLRKALELLSDFRPETLARLDIEVGAGSSLALVSSKGPLGSLTSAVGHVSNVLSDRGPRRAAIIGELEKRGFKTDAQVTRLLDDPRMRPVLNQIAEEAENAMVRFRGLGRVEREVLSRLIFIYPWLKGATRYGFHLGMDHPVKAAVVNAIGQEGYEEMRKRLGELVSYLQHLIPAGERRQEFGTTVVPVRSPLSITPVGTFGEVAAMMGDANEPDLPPSKRPIRYVQPTIRAAIEAASGVNIARGYSYKGKAPTDILADVTVRQYPLVRGIQTIGQEPQTEPFEGSPAKQPLYVREGGWKAGLSEIFVPARKRLLNLPAAQAKAAAEQRSALSDEKRVLYDDQKLRRELIEAAKAAKLGKMLDGKDRLRLDPPLRESISWLTRRNVARVKARNEKGQALNALEKWESDAQLAVRSKLLDQDAYRRHHARVLGYWNDPKLSRSRRDGKITREVTDMGLALFKRGYLDDALEALRDRGREVKRPALLGS